MRNHSNQSLTERGEIYDLSGFFLHNFFNGLKNNFKYMKKDLTLLENVSIIRVSA